MSSVNFSQGIGQLGNPVDDGLLFSDEEENAEPDGIQDESGHFEGDEIGASELSTTNGQATGA